MPAGEQIYRLLFSIYSLIVKLVYIFQLEKTLCAIDKKYEDDKIELTDYYEMNVIVENLNSNLNE